MPRQLFKKFSIQLIIGFSLTLIFAMLFSAILLDRTLKKQWTEDLATELFDMAQPLAIEIGGGSLVQGDDRLVQLTGRFGNKNIRRVSIIRSDGLMIADSDVSPSDLKSVENHSDRPEVQRGLKGENNFSIRFSHTVARPLLYAAVPLYQKGAITGVLRISVPLTMVELKLRHLRRTIAMVTLTTLFLALLASFLIFRKKFTWFDWIVQSAVQISHGRYESRVPRIPIQELDQLGQTMNLMAIRIQENIRDILHEKTQLTSILSNHTDGIGAVGSNGKILFMNPSLRGMLQISLDQKIEGQQFLDYIRHHSLNEMIGSVLKNKVCHDNEIKSLLTENHIYHVRIVPMMENDLCNGALFVLRDMTEIRHLEKMRSEFVANVSHELRTPLTAIKGFAETLRDGAWDDIKIRGEFVKSIEDHAHRMTLLVDDLLDLAAIESGKRVPKKEDLSLHKLIQEVVEALKPLAEFKKVKVSTKAEGSDILVEADKTQMKQVLMNLIDNAIKFNKDGGMINISSKIEADQAVMSIEDTGVGIPAEDIPRIFERFYRVDRSRSRELGGTGLGLAIVKHIIDVHGGAVAVTSSIGKGSIFTVRLPINGVR